MINVVKFNKISIEYDKEYYFGNDSIGTVRFKTERYDVTSNFSTRDYEVSIPVANGEINVHPPIIKWKINSDDWLSSTIEKPIRYR